MSVGSPYTKKLVYQDSVVCDRDIAVQIGQQTTRNINTSSLVLNSLDNDLLHSHEVNQTLHRLWGSWLGEVQFNVQSSCSGHLRSDIQLLQVMSR